jgi:hypothetical protein
MQTKHRSVFAFVLAFACQMLINFWWVLRPGKINSLWFVAGNILFGTMWVCSLSVCALRLIRGRKTDKFIESEFRFGRPVISLVASVLLANVIGFWLCNFRLCFFLLCLNLVVPIAWIVARKVLQSRERQTSGLF